MGLKPTRLLGEWKPLKFGKIQIVYILQIMLAVQGYGDGYLRFGKLTLSFLLLHQLLRPDEDSTSTQRYIESRTVQPRAKGAWISVDVTETIKDWVSDPGQLQWHMFYYDPVFVLVYLLLKISSSENNLGLKLGVHCPCCTFVPSTNNIVPNKSEELEALFAGVLWFFL